MTTEHVECHNGQPVVDFGDGEVYGPEAIQSVRVPFDCPIELFSAAAKAGFHLLRKKSLSKSEA